MKKSKKHLITLCLIDDSENQRIIWSRLLSPRKGFQIVGSFADAESALPFLLATPPNLALVDWKLGAGMDGLALIARLKAAQPKVLAVLITHHDLEELPVAAVTAGVDGCLLKTDLPTTLPARLLEVMNGTCVISTNVMRRLRERLHAEQLAAVPAPDPTVLLTPREVEVLAGAARGLRMKEQADQLGIGRATVKTHRESIVRKLGLKGITEAATHCAQWLPGTRGYA